MKVQATLLLAENPGTGSDAGEAGEPHVVSRATPEMIERRMKAMEELRAMGGLKDVIPDPVAWQREMREDRPLPGRD